MLGAEKSLCDLLNLCCYDMMAGKIIRRKMNILPADLSFTTRFFFNWVLMILKDFRIH